MKTRYREPQDSTEIANHPQGLRIDFSEIKKISIKKNIERCFLTGTIGPSQPIGGNIIASEIFELSADHIDWRENDIKDCLIKDSKFKFANCNVTALMSNIVTNTTYEECSFHNSSFTDTTFENVLFKNCNLKSLVIKRCNFFNCEFTSCQTSNKLIEHCVLENTRFSDIDLQLETILENFGLTDSAFSNVRIRIGERKLARIAALRKISELSSGSSALTSLEILNLKFFVEGQFERCGNELDSALEIRSWLPLCRIPSTLGNLLWCFTSFLINKYEDEKLPLSPLLRLYYITSQLTRRQFPDVRLAEFQANWSSASMRLLPYFEDYLFLVNQIAMDDFPNLMLLVEGPVDKDYFRDFFEKVIRLQGVEVEEVIPRNSPAELLLFFRDHLFLVSVVSVFLSSRLKVEIENLRSRRMLKSRSIGLLQEPSQAKVVKRKAKENLKILRKGNNYPQLLAFEMGNPEESNATYRLRLYAVYPEQIAINLQIDLKLALIYKIRGILLDLLNPRKQH